jgi:hypothetical protein
MGLTFRLGQLPTSLFTDASNNVGIGAAPSGSYKLEVTGFTRSSLGFIIPSTGGSNQSTLFVNTSSLHSASAGQNNFGFNTSNNIYFGKGLTGGGLGNGGVFLWNNTDVRYYTLPDTTGTLALGTGTTNYHAKWTGTNTIGNSLIFDNGTSVAIGTTIPDAGAPFTIDKTAAGLQTLAYFQNQQAAAADTGTSIYFLGTTSLNSLGRFVSAWEGASTSNSYMAFWTRGSGSTSEKLRITSAGQVFIGSTTPTFNTQLNITYNQSNYEGLAISSDKVYNGSPQPNLIFGGKYNSAGDYRKQAQLQSIKDNASDGNSSASLVFSTNGNAADVAERMRITSGGQVCINTTSNGAQFNLKAPSNDRAITFFNKSGADGSLWLYGTSASLDYSFSTWSQASAFYLYNNGNYDFAGSDVSDLRLKENIKIIDYNAIEKLMQLVPKSYNMIKHPDIKRSGFIAQEVQQVLPDFISGEETETDYLGVDYNGILALAVKAIQELNERLNKAGL